jgi:hypothetical protein
LTLNFFGLPCGATGPVIFIRSKGWETKGLGNRVVERPAEAIARGLLQSLADSRTSIFGFEIPGPTVAAGTA